MLNRALVATALLIAMPAFADAIKGLDRFQFRDMCERQLEKPGAVKLDCQCGAREFDRHVRKELERMDEAIREYEKKRDEGTEKAEFYERAAQQHRERRARYISDCLQMESEVFRDLLRKVARSCPPRR